MRARARAPEPNDVILVSQVGAVPFVGNASVGTPAPFHVALDLHVRPIRRAGPSTGTVARATRAGKDPRADGSRAPAAPSRDTQSAHRSADRRRSRSSGTRSPAGCQAPARVGR